MARKPGWRPPLDPEQRAKIRRLRAGGLKIGAIAVRFGVDPKVVRNILREAGP